MTVVSQAISGGKTTQGSSAETGSTLNSRAEKPKLSLFVGLARMGKEVRLPKSECLKTAVIRNLVQSGQEVLEIARKRCKFGAIEI